MLPYAMQGEYGILPLCSVSHYFPSQQSREQEQFAVLSHGGVNNDAEVKYFIADGNVGIK